jgi:hypothetical protein
MGILSDKRKATSANGKDTTTTTTVPMTGRVTKAANPNSRVNIKAAGTARTPARPAVKIAAKPNDAVNNRGSTTASNNKKLAGAIDRTKKFFSSAAGPKTNILAKFTSSSTSQTNNTKKKGKFMSGADLKKRADITLNNGKSASSTTTQDGIIKGEMFPDKTTIETNIVVKKSVSPLPSKPTIDNKRRSVSSSIVSRSASVAPGPGTKKIRRRDQSAPHVAKNIIRKAKPKRALECKGTSEMMKLAAENLAFKKEIEKLRALSEENANLKTQFDQLKAKAREEASPQMPLQQKPPDSGEIKKVEKLLAENKAMMKELAHLKEMANESFRMGNEFEQLKKRVEEGRRLRNDMEWLKAKLEENLKLRDELDKLKSKFQDGESLKAKNQDLQSAVEKLSQELQAAKKEIGRQEWLRWMVEDDLREMKEKAADKEVSKHVAPKVGDSRETMAPPPSSSPIRAIPGTARKMPVGDKSLPKTARKSPVTTDVINITNSTPVTAATRTARKMPAADNSPPAKARKTSITTSAKSPALGKTTPKTIYNRRRGRRGRRRSREGSQGGAREEG